MHTPPEQRTAADGPFNRPFGRLGGTRLWLFAGTGEGPPLARQLLQRGWRLRVSVVTAAAGRAYPRHPDLELAVGALGAARGETPQRTLARELRRAEALADPFAWVLDATHPFALQISAALAEVCREQGQPLLRLLRDPVPQGGALLLDQLSDLAQQSLPGERLLLAIGARRLAEAIANSPTALHHARVLPSPLALRQALAMGLVSDRLACLRPTAASLPVEIALCRRWRIDSVLCRQSGGEGERRWHHVCQMLGLRLLLLRRPPEPAGVHALPQQALLEQIGDPTELRRPPGLAGPVAAERPLSPGAAEPAPEGRPAGGDPAG